MTKVSGSETRKRNNKVTVNLDDAELALLDAKTRHAGMSRGSFMRKVSIGETGIRAKSQPTINAAAVASVIAIIHKLAPMIRDIRDSNIQPISGQAAQILADMQAVITQLLALTGRVDKKK